MSEPSPDRADAKLSKELSDNEAAAVDKRKQASAKVLHEVVRLQGDEDLNRPTASLLFSGFAAGIGISFSVLAQAFLHRYLPDVPGAELITSFGYCVGFVIVIMGHLQLFTESTVVPVLPVAMRPTWHNVRRLARLWTIVFLANIAGALVMALLVAEQVIVSSEQLTAATEISARLMERDAWTTLLLAMPAGFLIGAIAWILPNARGSEVWIIVILTYVIAIGGFSHVVAGATEGWLLWLTGEASLSWVVLDFLLPALAGNIVGGSGLFAMLAHAQVRAEI